MNKKTEKKTNSSNQNISVENEFLESDIKLNRRIHRIRDLG